MLESDNNELDSLYFNAFIVLVIYSIIKLILVFSIGNSVGLLYTFFICISLIVYNRFLFEKKKKLISKYGYLYGEQYDI